MHNNLADWLSYIQSLHPKNIEMGLSRINRMISRLNLKPSFKVISVAGTNGKGSTSAILENIYAEAGYQTGCYSSPHILRYNERVRIKQSEVNDALLCEAFSVIETARQQEAIALTYFEFGTLAAVWCFMQQPIDVAILEIGLGGRLDAVNAFEPDCAILTNVALDHQDYLGDTLDAIGKEKAGVFRHDKPAICGDTNLPESVKAHADNIGANYYLANQDFSLSATMNGMLYRLHRTGQDSVEYALPSLSLTGDFQMKNAACALTAVNCLQTSLPVKLSAISQAFESVTLAGRFEQQMQRAADGVDYPVIFDVAHNPHAAAALADNLLALNHAKAKTKTVAVFSMLADKDIEGVVRALNGYIDVWHIGPIAHARSASVSVVAQSICNVMLNAMVVQHDSLGEAFNMAINMSQDYKADFENVRIIVFGSFFTVAAVKAHLLGNKQ